MVTSNNFNYNLSLHDALPISFTRVIYTSYRSSFERGGGGRRVRAAGRARSEEHTSELQSRLHLVCRLLLEIKKMVDNRVNLSLGLGDYSYGTVEEFQPVVDAL